MFISEVEDLAASSSIACENWELKLLALTELSLSSLLWSKAVSLLLLWSKEKSFQESSLERSSKSGRKSEPEELSSGSGKGGRLVKTDENLLL